MSKELDEILNKLRGESTEEKPPSLPKSLKAQDKGIKLHTFDVPREAIYDRLRDGSYSAKYENYLGVTGNEERLAQQQSTGEKASRGIQKFLGKTVNNALDATIGTAYGLVQGISEGSWSAVWDNDFSNYLDDANKKMNNRLAHYYTEEEKNMDILKSLGTANFWFNDVGDGLAFVAGALLPEIAIGLATGGTSFGVGLGKNMARLGTKKLGKEAVELGITKSADDLAAKSLSGISDLNKVQRITDAKEGVSVVKNLNRAILGKKIGDPLSTAGFLFRTSHFEAGMEARHNFHDAMDNYIRTFEDKNGRQPTVEEISEFSKDAKTASNYLYGANLAILSVSNAAMFGKAFNLKLPAIKKTENFLNKAIGLGVSKTDEGVLVLQKANKLQKVAGRTFKLLEKPAMEGLYEEGFQGVAGKTMQKYLDAKYDPNSNSAEGMFSNLTDAFADQYGTKEGWKEMGIGMVIGMMGGVVQPFQTDADGKMKFARPSIPGFGTNSYKAARARFEEDITKANTGLTALKSMTSASSVKNFKNMAESGSGDYFSTSAENTIGNVEFIKSQEHLKSKKDILADYNATIDSLVFDEELSDDQANQYKDSLKQEFKQNLEDYNFATQAVSALGLDRKISKTPGDIDNIAEALTMNIVLGKNALVSAKNISEQLDTIIKPAMYGEEFQGVPMGGVYDILKHYTNLSNEELVKTKELSSKLKELKQLQDKAVTFQQELAKVQGERKGKLKDSTLEGRYNKVAEKALSTTQKITQLELETKKLEEALRNRSVAEEYDLDGTVSTNPVDIIQAINTIDKLNAYTDSLRTVGKNKEAGEIDYLLKQFKFHVDAHREMVNTHRDMFSTNFFSSDKGKTLIDKIIGQPYTMSEEFKEAVKNNSEVIDRSLNLVGIRDYGTIEGLVEDHLEKNPYLSQRDKHRLEALLRLQLNLGAISKRVEALQNTEINISAEEVINQDPLEGDTIALQESLDIKSKDLSTVKELDNVINSILKELSILRGESTNRNTKVKLTGELEDAKRRKDDLEKPESEQNADNPFFDIKDTNEIDNKIADLVEQIKNVGGEYNYVDSEDYKRLQELLGKLEDDNLSTAESFELDELQNDLNDWLLITGTVVEGFRLSDLIRQKIVLERTPIVKVEDVGQVSEQEIIDDIKFVDKPGYVDYSLLQTFDAATVKVKDGKFYISGVKPADFFDIVGFELPYETNKEKNIILSEEDVKNINENSENIRIAAVSEANGLTTTYNVVPYFKKDLNSEKGTALESNYTQDYPQGGMDIDAIYDLKVGEQVSLVADPNDLYNKELIATYKRAKSEKGKKEALDEIMRSMSVKIFRGDNFIGVLKATRGEGSKKSSDSLQFEAFRMSIAEQVMDVFLKGKNAIEVVSEPITVKEVKTGHPNFVFKKEGSSVSVEYRQLTEQDVEKVEDIGYVEKGKLQTMNKILGVDTTFLKKYIDSGSAQKIPFVVASRQAKRVAIPVKLIAKDKPSNKELEDIFNNKNTTDVQKAVALNKKLAERGIDIKEPGNAFISFGVSTNLSREFLDEKLAQLDKIEYFRPLNEWLDPKNSMEDILKNQILINVDLSNPIHSPKVRLDFSQVYENITVTTTTQASTPVKAKTKATKGSAALAQFNQLNNNNNTNQAIDKNNCPT